MDPLAVFLTAALGMLTSLAIGGLAIRSILSGKLMTIASHNEHVAQWQGQVEGLRKRLTEQETAHQAERDRANAAAEQRVIDAKQAAEERDEIRTSQLTALSRETDRLHAAIALADESYRVAVTARLNAQDSGLHAVATVLRASPLFDPQRHAELPTVVNDDRPADQPGPGGSPGD